VSPRASRPPPPAAPARRPRQAPAPPRRPGGGPEPVRRWAAICHPGLEAVVAEELTEAGLAAEPAAGHVAFRATASQGAALARSLRTPDRLLVELASGPTPSLDQLAALVRKADWRPFVHPQADLEVSVTSRASKVHFKESAGRRVEHAVAEALKGPRLPDQGARPRLTQRIQVRLDEDHATVSVDAGGELLHRRGWRTEGGSAPLRENLAASLIRLARWSGTEPLLDPFCGSGTIPIEAARFAAGRSPFLRRAFGCDEWPGLTRLPPGRSPPLGGPVHGSDRDPRALTRAVANAERAEVQVHWRQVDVADLEPPAAGGVIVTNPPWGLRLAPEAVASVYARFGHAVRTRFEGWRVVFLAPHPDLAARVHRDARLRARFTSGGVGVGVFEV